MLLRPFLSSEVNKNMVNSKFYIKIKKNESGYCHLNPIYMQPNPDIILSLLHTLLVEQSLCHSIWCSIGLVPPLLDQPNNLLLGCYHDESDCTLFWHIFSADKLFVILSLRLKFMPSFVLLK